MGMWYGSEVYTHSETHASDVVYESCIVIHLADITHQVTSESSQLFFPNKNDSFPDNQHDNTRTVPT